MPKKEDIVSLRRDLSALLWSGIPLQSSVDMLLWCERLTQHSRLIHARLVQPGRGIDMAPRGDFNLESLGHDYLHLETVGQEMMVIAQHATRISARTADAGMFVTLDVEGQRILFVLSAGIMGRWDWFMNPAEVPGVTMPFVTPCRVSDLYRQQAAN